jgi:hypothetical protein
VANFHQDRYHTVVMEVFSTITSSVFTELVIAVMDDAAVYLPREVALFTTLQMMHEVRSFKLVFLLEVADSCQEVARRELTEALNLVAAKGLLSFLGSPPTVR